MTNIWSLPGGLSACLLVISTCAYVKARLHARRRPRTATPAGAASPLCPVPRPPCATPSNARRHDRATCRSPTRRRRALTDPALRARHRGCRGCARCCSPRSVVRGAPSTRPPLSARGCTGKSRSRALRLPCTFCARATKIRVWGVQTRPTQAAAHPQIRPSASDGTVVIAATAAGGGGMPTFRPHPCRIDASLPQPSAGLSLAARVGAVL